MKTGSAIDFFFQIMLCISDMQYTLHILYNVRLGSEIAHIQEHARDLTMLNSAVSFVQHQITLITFKNMYYLRVI